MSRTPRLLPCPFVVVFAAFLVFAGCRADLANGSDPVAALRAAAPSHRYDVAYWAEQQHRRSSNWQAAWSFCRGRSEARYPNCSAIRLVGWIESPPPPPPAEPPAFLAEGGAQ